MRLRDEATIGESYAPAMEITTEEEAEEYLEALVERNIRVSGQSRKEAEAVERSNLGYYAGYYDQSTNERVQRLFRCSHPIFGKDIAERKISPEEAFTAGMKLAKDFKDSA